MKKILSILLTMLMLVSVFCIAPVSVSAADAQEITVYFENNWLWSDVFVHTWGSSVVPDTDWSKGAVELVGTSVSGYEVYKATVGSDATGIIFAGTKNDNSGGTDQTPDITSGFYDGVCYSMTWEDKNAVVAKDILDVCPDFAGAPDPEGPEAEPEETPDRYTVAGDFLYPQWDPDSNDMIYGEYEFDGKTYDYALTVTNVPGGDYRFKVTNGTWGVVNYPSSDYSFTTTGTSDITVYFNSTTTEIAVDSPSLDNSEFVVESVTAVGNGDGNWLNGITWDPTEESNDLTEVAPGVYEITYSNIGVYDDYVAKFVINHSWGYNWNIDGVFDGANVAKIVDVEGSDVTLRIDINGFDFNTKSGDVVTEFIVTPPEVTEPEATGDEPAVDVSCTVYYVDSAYMEQPYAYAWSGEGETIDVASRWPGVAMELTDLVSPDGSPVYSATFDKEYENIIFNDGAEVQTADLKFEGGAYLWWTNDTWYQNLEDIADDITPDYDTVTVYFQNNWLWSDVRCYYEGSEYETCEVWPGNEMEFFDNDGNYDVYYAVVPADASFIIFNGIMDDGSGNRDQTPNIEEFYNNDCYYMMWDNGNVVGSDDISVFFPETGEEEEVTESSIEGLSVTLGGKIGYNLHYKISSDIMADPSAKFVVYRNSEPWYEIPATEYNYYDDETGYYVFTVELAAKEMADRIATKVVTDTYNTFFNVNSLAGYCDRILEDPVKYAREQDLVKAMLNYGAASQAYFGYGTDYYANNNLTAEDKVVTVRDHSYYAPVIEGEANAVEFFGASLVLESNTYLKFYFKVDETKLPEGVAPNISINGLSGAMLEANGNLWTITIQDLAAHELSTEFVLGLGGQTVTYSAYSYIHTAQQSSKTELIALVNALGAYGYEAGLYGID